MTPTDPTPGLKVRVPDRRKPGNRLRGQVGVVESVYFNEAKRLWLAWVKLPEDGGAWDGLLHPAGWAELEVMG